MKMRVVKTTAKFIRKRVGYKVSLTTRRLRDTSPAVLIKYTAKRSLAKDFPPVNQLTPVKEQVEEGAPVPMETEAPSNCCSPDPVPLSPSVEEIHVRRYRRQSKSLPLLTGCTPKRLQQRRMMQLRPVVSCRSLARRQQISNTMQRSRLNDQVRESIQEEKELSTSPPQQEHQQQASPFTTDGFA
jgi:hypothetical protein